MSKRNPTVGAIGIYRGAFDPPHLSHLEVVKNAINVFELSKLIVYVKYIGKKDLYASVDERIKMMNLQLTDLHLPVKVIREGTEGFNKVIEKLSLSSKVPIIDICGLDKIIYEMTAYGNSKNLLFGLNLRQGYVSEAAEAYKFARTRGLSIFTISPNLSISSSLARQVIQLHGNTHGILHPRVEKYIRDQKLYIANKNSDSQQKLFLLGFRSFIKLLEAHIENLNFENIPEPEFNPLHSISAWKEKYIRRVIQSLALRREEFTSFKKEVEIILKKSKFKS
jgi:cytidyltransferase-like protein